MVKQTNSINALPVLNSLSSRGLGNVVNRSIRPTFDLNDAFVDRITSDDEQDKDEILDELLDADDLIDEVEFENVFVNARSFSRFVH